MKGGATCEGNIEISASSVLAARPLQWNCVVRIGSVFNIRSLLFRIFFINEISHLTELTLSKFFCKLEPKKRLLSSVLKLSNNIRFTLNRVIPSSMMY